MREFIGWSIVLLATGLLCGAAWLTRHPDAPIVSAAAEWSLVGPLAERFQRAYLGPDGGERDVPVAETTAAGPRPRRPRPASDMASSGPLTLPPPPGVPDLKGASSSDPAAAEPARRPSASLLVSRIYPRVWLWPGLAMRRVPEPSSPVLAQVRELACVPTWDSRPGWVEVTLRGVRGWVEARPATVRMSHRMRPETAVPSARLAQALALAGLSEPVGRIGSFDLYTAVRNSVLLDLLATGGSAVEGAYSQRYGLALSRAEPRPAIVLLAGQRDYRRLRTAYSRLGSVHPRAFAVGGLVVGHTGIGEESEILVALMHEMTHALNRRALGAPLPPWLEEGMATDLGLLWYEDPDAPAPGLIAGRDGLLRPQGIYRMLDLVEGGVPPLETLIAEDRTAFFGEVPEARYAQSVLFVRYLLDGEDGRLATPFRDFLGSVATGESPSGDRLLHFLGRDWRQLETGYGRFVATLIAERDLATDREGR